jgi:hypothetical protein
VFDGLRAAGEWLAGALGFVIGGILIIAFLGSGIVSHEACVHRETGEVRYGDWAVDPLAWFGVSTVGRREICESETGTVYVVGFVPSFGEFIAANIGGGPSNPDYWDNRPKLF